MTLSDTAPGGIWGGFNAAGIIDATTRVVSPDEPCFYLGEFDLPSRSGKSKSRFQMLRVVRGDRLVRAYVYLGPAKTFKADQFQMIGGVVEEDGKGTAYHTVGELQEGAEELRNQPPRRELEPSDLVSQFKDYSEEKQRLAVHQSTFGAGVVKVR